MSDASIEPSPWIARFATAVPARGHVLDLASGGGRHVRFLAARGHHVTAVDRDLARVAELTDEFPGRVELIEADLEAASWPLADRRFDAVIVTNYLWRPLRPHIVAAVAEGGILLYETFGVGNEAFGRPSNPDYLLKKGELLTWVSSEFRIAAYEFGEIGKPARAVVSRIAASRIRA